MFAPVGSRGSEPSTARRRELLAVAADLFAHTGYAQTSLRQIADAAGILPGSLYHHFDSKESMAAELLAALRSDLDALVIRFAAEPGGGLDVLRSLARETAGAAERHLAAVELCTYEAPTASPLLADLLDGWSVGLEQTWHRLVVRAGEAGRLRIPPADVPLLAQVLYEGSWAMGPVASRGSSAVLADVLTGVLFRGLATGSQRRTGGGSSIAAVVDRAELSWADDGNALRRTVLDAARDEFGRRGFEAATMRHVARAAGIGVASLYRSFPSKEALLLEIVDGFSGPLVQAFRDVEASAGDPVDALGGLVDVMTRAGRTARREYGIVRIWWRVIARTGPDAGLAEQRERFAILRGVLADGMAAGVVRKDVDVDSLAVAVRELLWLPFHRLDIDPSRLQELLRRTVVGTGVAVPRVGTAVDDRLPGERVDGAEPAGASVRPIGGGVEAVSDAPASARGGEDDGVRRADRDFEGPR